MDSPTKPTTWIPRAPRVRITRNRVRIPEKLCVCLDLKQMLLWPGAGCNYSSRFAVKFKFKILDTVQTELCNYTEMKRKLNSNSNTYKELLKKTLREFLLVHSSQKWCTAAAMKMLFLFIFERCISWVSYSSGFKAKIKLKFQILFKLLT